MVSRQDALKINAVNTSDREYNSELRPKRARDTETESREEKAAFYVGCFTCSLSTTKWENSFDD